MFRRRSPGGMSNILRFNIVAGGGCAAYYLWSKYSNWKSLQADYCTAALQLVQDYPQMQQILGKGIRLTKLIARGDADRFTDLSQLGGGLGAASVRVKCELKGSKRNGLLFVWATVNPQQYHPTSSSQAVSILDPQPSAKSPSLTIDRLDLQLTGSGVPPAQQRRWTLYESFLNRNAKSIEQPPNQPEHGGTFLSTQ